MSLRQLSRWGRSEFASLLEMVHLSKVIGRMFKQRDSSEPSVEPSWAQLPLLEEFGPFLVSLLFFEREACQSWSEPHCI